MEKLLKAEELDSFFQTVNADPVNRRARSSLIYQASQETTQPWLLGTEIVTMAPTAEAGMPHTRPPNLICMPIYYPEEALQQTLAHELVHIDQRNRKYKWDAWFEKEGWSPLHQDQIPSRWLQRCRLNPDTVDSRFWAWKQRHVPLPLYEREDRPDLRQVVIHWWDRETGIKQAEAPRLFQERYGRFPSQPEHPRELAAVELSKRFQTPSDIDSYLRR
jgi:hypothetical protein